MQLDHQVSPLHVGDRPVLLQVVIDLEDGSPPLDQFLQLLAVVLDWELFDVDGFGKSHFVDERLVQADPRSGVSELPAVLRQ